MRVAEFIEWAAPKPDDERWELLDGEPVLMAPQSEPHQVSVANLLSLIREAAQKEKCRALPGLGLLDNSIDDFTPIPDVIVCCGPIGATGYAKDSIFSAEVLSQSTMGNDRGRKSAFYKSFSSLHLLIIVFQDERRIEVLRRENDVWTCRGCGLGDVIALPRPAVTLAVADIYAGLTF